MKQDPNQEQLRNDIAFAKALGVDSESVKTLERVLDAELRWKETLADIEAAKAAQDRSNNETND